MAFEELGVNLRDAGHVLLIEAAHQHPRVALLRGCHDVLGRLSQQLATGPQQARQPQTIQLLRALPHPMAVADGLMQLLVLGEDALDPRPDLEVLQGSANVVAQLTVLILTLFPPSGHDGDWLIACDHQLVDGFTDYGVAALWAEHDRRGQHECT